MNPVRLARLERRFRPLLKVLPPGWAIQVASAGRRRFAAALAACPPPEPVAVPDGLAVTPWPGLTFRTPLLNAAGMFKNGEAAELAYAQGAGGYLAGTTTARPRAGNQRAGVRHPFVPYPRSGAASNWLGLPNEGHRAVAERLAALPRRGGFPIGASLAFCPDADRSEEVKCEDLAAGLRAYDAAGVDFLELNESCPNTDDDSAGWERLEARLAFVAEAFLERRERPLPVVVKLSLDTPLEVVPRVVGKLIALGFGGVNFGNTSVAYDHHRAALDRRERRVYDRFTKRFGGGLSGRILRDEMLDRVRVAAREAGDRPGFAVVATGGIETAGDVAAAQAAGAQLCQWYTGYFDNLGRHGHGLYAWLCRTLG